MSADDSDDITADEWSGPKNTLWSALRMWWKSRNESPWGRFLHIDFSYEELVDRIVPAILQQVEEHPDDRRDFQIEFDRLAHQYSFSRVPPLPVTAHDA